MIEDRSEWTERDHEMYGDWLDSLTPWQFVAYLAQDDKVTAIEYARSARCDTIERGDGARVKVAREWPLHILPEGLSVPVVAAQGVVSVFVPTPRIGG